jgi:glycosyltransferase involved in cell wall biosynthesis
VILISHPTANQNVRQTARALAEAGLLGEFWTCVNWKQDGFLDRYLPFPTRVRKELRRRSFRAELEPFIRTFPWREWGRLLSGQLGLKWTTKDETGVFSMDAVYVSLDRRVARRLLSSRGIEAVYAYDNGALESFRAAKNCGMKCIYEHPIVYWRKVREYQLEEAEMHPEWAPTLGALGDSEEKLARKDQELALADAVIVPSTFSKNSLAHAPDLKVPVQVIAYGAPSVSDGTRTNDRSGRLRVLFVGALSQAKGLGYLLQAAAHLGHRIELTLIGQRVSAVIPERAVLDRYRWIPSLPHEELLQEMSRHDVLVLPSLHEGFGLVIPEAMAQGLVVITTPHTAGPDLITDGVDGFVIPIRSAEAIEEKLDRLMTDGKLLSEMKLAARRKAEMRPWETYRRQLASMARALIQ